MGTLTLQQQRSSEQSLIDFMKSSRKTSVSGSDATILEFRNKLRMAEELIAKLGFSLREIQEMKRLI